MLKLSPGKLWGMRRLADANGRWKMIAIDQRTPLMGPVAQKKRVERSVFQRFIGHQDLCHKTSITILFCHAVRPELRISLRRT